MVGDDVGGDIAFDIFGHVFIGAEDKKRASAGFPSCGASYAVNVSVFAEGKMIVDDIVDVGNIESSRSKVGADEDIRGSITKLVDGVLALFLFETSVEEAYGKALAQQKVCCSFHSISIVEEDDAAGFTEGA